MKQKKIARNQELKRLKEQKASKEIDAFIKDFFGSSELKYMTLIFLALGFICLVNYIAINELHFPLPLSTRRGKPYPNHLLYPTIIFIGFWLLFKLSQGLIFIYDTIKKRGKDR